MEVVGIFHDNEVRFTALWYILWLFYIFCGNLVYFSLFGTFVPKEIWQHCLRVFVCCGDKPENEFAFDCVHTYITVSEIFIPRKTWQKSTFFLELKKFFSDH
jgi:hypothetical protein